MDFSELAACCVAVAEVVSGSNGCMATKWTFPTGFRVHIIIGIEKDLHCRILNNTEQAIGRVENKSLFHSHIAYRLLQAFRQIGEVRTEIQTGIKQNHTKLPNRIQTLD